MWDQTAFNDLARKVGAATAAFRLLVVLGVGAHAPGKMAHCSMKAVGY